MKNIFFFLFILLMAGCSDASTEGTTTSKDSSGTSSNNQQAVADTASGATLDTALYNRLMTHMANGDTTGRWPVKTDYPLPGAILPFKRIIAYYGNLYSNRMGALAKWPKAEM
ncbi:MAG: hypothetical protein WKF70_06250, partial [Chitinophagaceae bacterium]